jgi:hypothetical protein
MKLSVVNCEWVDKPLLMENTDNNASFLLVSDWEVQ